MRLVNINTLPLSTVVDLKLHDDFFTKWHDIAHCLTSFEQFEMPFRRTTVTAIEKDPIEKLMDIIAGDVGFFDPLFRPFLEAEITHHGLITFQLVETMRTRFFNEASFQATLNACVAKSRTPTFNLEAGLGLKKGESELLLSTQRSLEQLNLQAKLRVIQLDAKRRCTEGAIFSTA
jgi:hypothetical protein